MPGRILAAYKTGPLIGTAVFAITRSAVVHWHQGGLDLGTSLSASGPAGSCTSLCRKGRDAPRHSTAGPTCVLPSRPARACPFQLCKGKAGREG